MIGKGHWFKRRKYGGWGIFPKTWQGWVYTAVAMGIILAIQALPIDETSRLTATGIFVLIFVLDAIDIMRKLPMDERERIHEAIAERNALWAILIALAAGLCWQIVTGLMVNNIQIDPVIIIAILVAVIAKAISNIYLDRKN